MSNATETNLSTEVSVGVAAKIVMHLLGFLGTIVFARALNADGLGAFYLVVALENVVDRPIVGFAEAAKKRLSETDRDLAEIFGSYLSVYLLVLVAVAVLAVVFRGWLVDYIGDQHAPLYLVGLVATLAFYESVAKIHTATGKVGMNSWVDTVRSGVTLPAQVTLVVLGYGVFGMVTGLALATTLTIPIFFRLFDISIARPSRQTLTSLWTYARHSIPSALIGIADTKAGLLLVGLLLTPAAAGYYEIAFKVSSPALFVAGLAAGGLMPRVSKLHSRGERVSNEISNVLAFGSVLSIPLFFGALAMGTRIVTTLYGASYRPAGVLLVGITLYRLLTTQSKPLASALNGIDRPDVTLRVKLATLTVNIAVAIALIHFGYGVVGAVVGAVVSQAIAYVSSLVLLTRRVESLDVFPRPLRVQMVAGVVMFVVVVGLRSVVAMTWWFPVFAIVGIGGVIYSGLVFAGSPTVRHTARVVLADVR